MEEVVKPGLLPQAFELVRQHKAEGATVIVVTATNEFVTTPIAQAFGMDVLLAVQLVRDVDGNFTGEIDGTPTLREGKVTRVNQWLQAQGLSLSEVHATFYSDSMNDLPLLEKVDIPVVTNAGPELKQIAQERGWRILDLFETS
jgi:HAD superfamily hydrolase (TIGR01490 family)